MHGTTNIKNINGLRSLGKTLVVRSFGILNTELFVSRWGRKCAVIVCCNRCEQLTVELRNGDVGDIPDRIVGTWNEEALKRLYVMLNCKGII